MKYRILFNPDCMTPSYPYVCELVETLEQARALLEEIRKYTLYLQDSSLISDRVSYGLIEAKDDNCTKWEVIK